VVNTGSDAADLAFVLPFTSVTSPAKVTVLSGSPNTFNTPEVPNAVVPAASELDVDTEFTYSVPAYSLSVITFEAE